MLVIAGLVKAVKIDLDYLAKAYFYFDEPVIYSLTNETSISIKPVFVRQSEIFLSSIDIINIDKNSFPSVEIIQMSYLRFLREIIAQDEISRQKFVNILVMCLGLKKPRMYIDENNKAELIDDELGIRITGKQFEDIKRIIMYQNIIHYDDEYVNPELKKAMAEMDEIRNKGIEVPSLERKMAIIMAHNGMSKAVMQDMTYRSFSMLFDEVCGEVEYTTTRPIALYGGEADKVCWIFKKKKNKFDGYIVDQDAYANSMGANQGAIKSIVGNSTEGLEAQFNSINK